MAGQPMPYVKIQFLDNNGFPAAFHQVFFYYAGTNTKLATYSDSELTTENDNPIVLDAAGRAAIFWQPTAYKVVLTGPDDTDPPNSPIWTVDNVQSYGGALQDLDVTGVAGENILTGDLCYLADSQGDNNPGEWYRTDADNTWSSNGAYIIGFATGDIAVGEEGSFRRSGRMTGLSGLTAGTVYYASATVGQLTSTPPTNAVVAGKADSTTSIVLDPQWGNASATVMGLVDDEAQSFTGVKTFAVQPETMVGTATTQPGTVAGQFNVDVSARVYSAPSGSFDITIPADMLDADGKVVHIFFGSSSATTGADNKSLSWQVFQSTSKANGPVWTTGTGNYTSWQAAFKIVRIDSDSLDVGGYFGPAAGTLETRQTQRANSMDFTTDFVFRVGATVAGVSTVTVTYSYAVAVG